jgi:coenzyme F420-reducing hydrogenase beta subunit
MNETSTMLSHCKFYLFFFLLTSTRAFPSKLLSKGRVAHKVKASAIPIDGDDWPDRFPAKEHCSRCGLCETTFVSQVTNACAFIGPGMARIDKLEEQVHGRKRKLDDMTWSSDDSPQVKNGMADEGRFGVLHEPVKLARGVEKNAQWTGCVTGIALAMLESKMVDAVVCIASDPDKDWASPQPILAKTPEEVLRGRGVKVRTILFEVNIRLEIWSV